MNNGWLIHAENKEWIKNNGCFIKENGKWIMIGLDNGSKKIYNGQMLMKIDNEELIRDHEKYRTDD